MIAAFARAARVLRLGRSRRRRPYLDAAARAASFISETLWSADGTLLRRYRDGEAAIDGYAEDYAYLIWGLLELFQADGDSDVARVGARASARSRTRCSGTRRRRLVQYHGRRSDRAPSAEGRLRRRRAGRELGFGAQHADAVAPDGRRSVAAKGRTHARRATVRASARRANNSDDAVRLVGLARGLFAGQ